MDIKNPTPASEKGAKRTLASVSGIFPVWKIIGNKPLRGKEFFPIFSIFFHIYISPNTNPPIYYPISAKTINTPPIPRYFYTIYQNFL